MYLFFIFFTGRKTDRHEIGAYIPIFSGDTTSYGGNIDNTKQERANQRRTCLCYSDTDLRDPKNDFRPSFLSFYSFWMFQF